METASRTLSMRIRCSPALHRRKVTAIGRARNSFSAPASTLLVCRLFCFILFFFALLFLWHFYAFLMFNCLHSVAPVYVITMCQPVSENPGRRYLRSAVRRDLVVPATRTVRFGPCSFAAADCPLGTLFQSETPKPATLHCVLPSSSEDCTVSQSVQYFTSTLVTVWTVRVGEH